MRLIPGKTKVKIELFKGITLIDVLIGLAGLVSATICAISSLPGRYIIAVIVAGIFAVMLVRLDDDPMYVFVWHILKYRAYPRRLHKVYDDKTLERMSTGTKEENMEAFLEETEGEEEIEVEELSEKEEKKKLKELIKQENKILKSKTATKEEKDAVWLARANRSAQKKKEKDADKESNASSDDISEIIPFTGIKDDFIEYGGKYYGAAIEIDPVEFRFFSKYRRDYSIENCLGRILRGLQGDYGANIVKLERPIVYDEYLDAEYDKLDRLRESYESGLFTEDELKARVEIQYDRINEIRELCNENKVIEPFYYLVLFESDKRRLSVIVRNALQFLEQGELKVRRLDNRGLALFLKYSNGMDFDENQVDKIKEEDWAKWAMPESVRFTVRRAIVNNIVTHNFRNLNYPTEVGDAWLAGVMSYPATKVVVKVTPMDNNKAIRSIDRSLSELRGQYMATSTDSKVLELQEHIETLSELLVTLQQENENLMSVNVYVTGYDSVATKEDPLLGENFRSDLPIVTDMKKAVKRSWNEAGMRLSGMDFMQLQSFVGGQISAYDPFLKEARGIPTNTIAAMYPWIYAHISDKGGIKLGSADGVPVFIDFFRRDSERVNSNMVIVGKSGSGKSYATKSLLTNLASEDSKIFILDPENEYSELAHTLHGKVINVGNAKYGRLNPFHIITALDDDEAGSGGPSGSFATHLQFLEEFFKQILPDIDKEALEYLNSLVERVYLNFGITAETDLSKLKSTDYPIFDDLYDVVLSEFERTNNEYLRNLLRTLVNYISKFSTGGRNANIWNGPSTITTDENFSVFNFQSMLANRNTTIANAQMLLVLKYIDNEIIKNRDYNLKYNLKRKVVVVIDEAHVFIDNKFPVALDFMFQLAKRIRKYNGMQIVITQNIKDFVGTEEIARKSTAIINACQYSFVFSLAPNDMDDLCKLYEKAGGINEREQEDIVSARRGQVFTIMSPTSRSSFMIDVPESFVDMFENKNFISNYFTGEKGEGYWEDFVAESRDKHALNYEKRMEGVEIPVIDFDEEDDDEQYSSGFTFSEISAEEAEDWGEEKQADEEPKRVLLANYDDDEEEEESEEDRERTELIRLKDEWAKEGLTYTEEAAAERELEKAEEETLEDAPKKGSVDRLIEAEELVNRKEYELQMGRPDVSYMDNQSSSSLNDNVKYVSAGASLNQANLEDTLNKFKETLRKEMEEELMEKIKWINVGANAAMAGGMAMAAGGTHVAGSKAASTLSTKTKKSVTDEIDDLLSEENNYNMDDLEEDELFPETDDSEDLFSDDSFLSEMDESDVSEDSDAVGIGDYLIGDDFEDFDDDDDLEDIDFGEDIDDLLGDDDEDDEDDDDINFDDDDDFDDDDFDDDEDEEYEPAPFLFAELLSEAAEEYADMSLEDRMSEAGKEVMEITVEDLADYIKAMRKKKK